MRHYIIYIKWENSQFEGYVYQEFGLDVVEKIESPDFNQFIQLAEGCIEILEPEFLKTDNRYPEWYKNQEYYFTYQFADVASLLKAYNTYVPLATLSKVTHINKGLLSHYANRLKVPREKQRDTIIKTFQEIGTRLMNTKVEFKNRDYEI